MHVVRNQVDRGMLALREDRAPCSRLPTERNRWKTRWASSFEALAEYEHADEMADTFPVLSTNQVAFGDVDFSVPSNVMFFLDASVQASPRNMHIQSHISKHLFKGI